VSKSTYTFNTSPLDQFEIRNLISLDAPILGNLHISLTNIGLYLTIGAFLALSINILATTKDSIVTNLINPTKGQIYFSFIYALFIFILINNLIGMVPYSFASTSHFILAFAISFTCVFGAYLFNNFYIMYKEDSLFIKSKIYIILRYFIALSISIFILFFIFVFLLVCLASIPLISWIFFYSIGIEILPYFNILFQLLCFFILFFKVYFIIFSIFKNID
jgi:hypothetical protein